MQSLYDLSTFCVFIITPPCWCKAIWCKGSKVFRTGSICCAVIQFKAGFASEREYYWAGPRVQFWPWNDILLIVLKFQVQPRFDFIFRSDGKIIFYRNHLMHYFKQKNRFDRNNIGHRCILKVTQCFKMVLAQCTWITCFSISPWELRWDFQKVSL